MLNVFVCLFMVSSTITGASSNNTSRSCTLPMYPTYGTYTVTSDPSAKPGQTVDSFVMKVSCRRGYGIEESGNLEQEVFCVGGLWTQQMPKCVRFCRLNAHHSMRYECRLPGQGLGTCEGFVPPRTNVIVTCKPQFYSANEVEYMNCMEYGIWDRTVSCQAECGVVTPQAELQLVGGRFAKFGEFPWHVGVYDKTQQPYGQLCGGSIITSNVVISAAHCFWDDVIKLLPESQFIVATAKLYRKWNDERDILAQKSEIKKIKIPSLFHGSAASFQQDIAILILKSRFTYLPYVRPVCYDFNSFFEREQLQHGNLGKISGWGLTAANGGPSPTLKVADIPFVSEDVCDKSVPKSFKAYITGDKFCAGYTDGTSAVCKGDSGGGLVFPALERNKERYYLRGIVSASPRNDDKICNDYTYAAFTKMTAHMKFIIESIAESTPMACNSYLFQCNDGTCVYPEAECNGIADCKDGSDESYENCTPGAKTTTTTQAPQVCILPPYPEHGRYEVVNKPNAKPGFQADSFVVSVSCDSDFGVETDGIVNGTATAEVYCFDGEWITELPECVHLCKNLDCPRNHECIVYKGEAECINREGYHGGMAVSVSCKTLACDTLKYSKCLTIEGVAKCVCIDGFAGNPSSSSGCRDDNECIKKPCGAGALCINLPGAHQCKCPDGFTGDPDVSCLGPKVECSDDNPCPKNERCKILSAGGTVCDCEKGFKRGETGICEDIDECNGIANCGNYAYCRNSPGSFKCICPYVACGDCKDCEN